MPRFIACILLAGVVAWSPPIAAQQTPAPPMHFAADRGIVHVISLAGDIPTSARLTLALFAQLNRSMGDSVTKPRIALVAQPSWGYNDLVAACNRDPQTRGGIIIGSPAVFGAVDNYLLLNRSWTQLDTTVMLATCGHPPTVLAGPVTPPAPPPPESGSLTITCPISKLYSGAGSRNSGTFLPIAILLNIVATISSLHETSRQETQTYTVPAPLPSAPAGQPVLSSTTSVSSVANSGASLGSLGATLASTLAPQSASVGLLGSESAQSARAAANVAKPIAQDIATYITSERAPAFASACKPATQALVDWYL